MKTAQKSVHMTPYLTPYLNFEALVLGCIGTYRGVQRLILQRFSNSTRKKQAGLTDSLKNAKFGRAQTCRRAVSSRTTRIPYRGARKKSTLSNFLEKSCLHPNSPPSPPIGLRLSTSHLRTEIDLWFNFGLNPCWLQKVMIETSWPRFLIGNEAKISQFSNIHFSAVSTQI